MCLEIELSRYCRWRYRNAYYNCYYYPYDRMVEHIIPHIVDNYKQIHNL